MIHNMTQRDLCTVCTRAPDCAYLTGSGRPVHDCEEFESKAFVPTKTAGKDLHPAPELSVLERTDPRRYKGLCSDCEDLDVCMFTKPEGGIWQCEEYR